MFDVDQGNRSGHRFDSIGNLAVVAALGYSAVDSEVGEADSIGVGRTADHNSFVGKVGEVDIDLVEGEAVDCKNWSEGKVVGCKDSGEVA